MATSLAFCGKSLWDPNLLLNVTSKDSTLCVENTVLVWLPCGLLWLLTLYEARRIHTSVNGRIPWNLVNVFRMFLAVCLSVMATVELVYRVNASKNSGPLFSLETFTVIFKLLSYILVTFLIWYHRLRGIFTSGPLFLFWLLLSFAEVLNFKATVEALYDPVIKPHLQSTAYVIQSAYVPIVLSMFILYCFADKYPERMTRVEGVEKKCPESTSSFLNRITFMWFTPMILLGYKRPLTQNDIWDLDAWNQTEFLLGKFSKYWHSIKMTFVRKGGNDNVAYQEISPAPKSSGILVALLKTFWPLLLGVAGLKFVGSVLTFANPILLDYLISFISSDEPFSVGLMYAIIMFLTSTLVSIVNAQYDYQITIATMRMRACLIATIYNKSLKLSSTGTSEFTTGQIVNLMAVDTQKVVDSFQVINLIWSTPLQIGIATYLLWQQLGIATLAGLAVMIMILPLNGWITTRLKKYQFALMRDKDKRNKIMNELLNGMKVLKLFAWENLFKKQIIETRDKELCSLKSQAYWSAGTTFSFACAPIFIVLAAFTTYVLVDVSNILDPNKAFVSLSLFNILRFPLALLPFLLNSTITAFVSIRRINKYMNSEEIDPANIIRNKDSELAVSIKHGSFSWKAEDEPTLQKINIDIKPNKLVAVVGTVGCGKSSLLSAILGEMHKNSGTVNVNGSIAYVPQQAWIKNETIRQNILFTKPMDESRYRKVLKLCELEPDLSILEGGDLCEIGEKGINLSGGQKQRVSLARAVYFDADIYLLDDPLSAVDVHVSRQLFDKVIGPRGMLKSKTRVLVTHRITVLPQVDEIIVLKNGQISERGSYQELLDKKGDFAEILMEYMEEKAENIDDPEEVAVVEELKETLKDKFSRQTSRVSTATSGDGSVPHRRESRKDSETTLRQRKPEKAKLVQEERQETGSVKLSVYKDYILAMGPLLFALVIGCNILSSVFNIFTNLWLTAWSDDGLDPVKAKDTSLRNTRLGVYALLGVGEALCILGASVTLNLINIKGARVLHNAMLERIILAPMSFFDTTPLGRILNRFGKDVDIADTAMAMNVRMMVMTTLRCVAALSVIAFESPYIIVAFIPIFVLYYVMQKYYVASSRQLKRIESVTRSPIYTHFSETITGLSSIRAYNVGDNFVHECYRRVDTNHGSLFAGIIASRWLAIILEFLGYIIVFIAATFAVSARGTISPGIAGLSITYALSISGTLNMLVRASSNLETNIVSIERIIEYSKVPIEAPRKIEGLEPPPEWPSKGQIKFKNYSTRYRKDLKLVLKNIDCEFYPSEKIGIVGRTGAGKSSFVLALFRLVEPAEGTIIIDDVDITKIGLETLRSRLTIIPQDPVLFTGTLRINLDPSETMLDQEIWRALELVSLKDFVSGLDAGLSHLVVEGGENLSVGQRQLFCLARAVLRRSKILILDEATAAVDYETDSMIQTTIRNEFKDCTVLTIAHRLNTVIDYDRLLILDNGTVAEFDTPVNLLEKNDSMFYAMARDAGIV